MLVFAAMRVLVPSKTSAAIPIFAAAAIALVVSWFVASNSTRPVEELVLTVEAITTRASNNGKAEPERTAIVRTPDGRLLQARIATHDPLSAGHKAKVIVTEQVLSGDRTYEVIGEAEAK